MYPFATPRSTLPPECTDMQSAACLAHTFGSTASDPTTICTQQSCPRGVTTPGTQEHRLLRTLQVHPLDRFSITWISLFDWKTHHGYRSWMSYQDQHDVLHQFTMLLDEL